MKMEELMKILKSEGKSFEDFEEDCDILERIIAKMGDELKQSEPYATKTISDFYLHAYFMHNLPNLFEEND